MPPVKFGLRSYGAPVAPPPTDRDTQSNIALLDDARLPLLAHHRSRGMRKAVRVSARYRDDRGWHDFEIRDVSFRGLGGRGSTPPEKGAYIDIAFRDQALVGRVIWTRGVFFGVRLASVPKLRKANGALLFPSDPDAQKSGSTLSPAMAYQAPVPQAAQDALAKGRRTEFLFLVFGAISAVLMIASLAYAALVMPVNETARALDSQSGELAMAQPSRHSVPAGNRVAGR